MTREDKSGKTCLPKCSSSPERESEEESDVLHKRPFCLFFLLLIPFNKSSCYLSCVCVLGQFFSLWSEKAAAAAGEDADRRLRG